MRRKSERRRAGVDLALGAEEQRHDRGIDRRAIGEHHQDQRIRRRLFQLVQFYIFHKLLHRWRNGAFIQAGRARKVRIVIRSWSSWRKSTTRPTSTASTSSRQKKSTWPRGTASKLSRLWLSSAIKILSSTKASLLCRRLTYSGNNNFGIAGDIRDEKKVLAWFTDQGNLELADQIEEVNEKMLKKLIGSSAHVVAFFCKRQWM